jgi:hypothetical protein
MYLINRNPLFCFFLHDLKIGSGSDFIKDSFISGKNKEDISQDESDLSPKIQTFESKLSGIQKDFYRVAVAEKDPESFKKHIKVVVFSDYLIFLKLSKFLYRIWNKKPRS